MIEGIQLKVCGLTTASDAARAAHLGADFLGFIFHEKSPRNLSLDAYREFAGGLPKAPRVAVTVEPSLDALRSIRDAGFERFQIHFGTGAGTAEVEGWSREVGASNLWLAPKLPPKADIAAGWLDLCGAVLLDTFDPVLFGGTGRTGDWAKFRRLSASRPGFTWILSGGLKPDNIAEALRESGARFVDVNSGVESSPGVKDPTKLEAFAKALRAARTR